LLARPLAQFLQTNGTMSTLWLLSRTCFLSALAIFPPAFVFIFAFFGAVLFFANFFSEVTLI
jgi:hypothetical protein